MLLDFGRVTAKVWWWLLWFLSFRVLAAMMVPFLLRLTMRVWWPNINWLCISILVCVCVCVFGRARVLLRRSLCPNNLSLSKKCTVSFVCYVMIRQQPTTTQPQHFHPKLRLSFFSAARCVYASQIDFCSTKHDEHAPRFAHIDDDNNNNNNNTHQRKMEAKQRQQ